MLCANAIEIDVFICSFDSNSEDFCDGAENKEEEEEEKEDIVETLFCGLNFRIPNWLNRFRPDRRKHESSTPNVFYRRRN